MLSNLFGLGREMIPEQGPLGSGLRRSDGSLVPVQGTPFKGETFNQIPEQYREGFAEFIRNNPKYRVGGMAISYATLPDGNRIQFGDTGSASGFTEYLKTLNTPNGTGTQMPIGGTPYNPPGSVGTLGPGPDNIANQPANPTPIDNTGIGSLTPTPVNQIPESSSIAGSITSPYLNNNQDFDEYLNSYINNQINTRMRDIFSGIMNIFK